MSKELNSKPEILQVILVAFSSEFWCLCVRAKWR
jgi:hypothetical protein